MRDNERDNEGELSHLDAVDGLGLLAESVGDGHLHGTTTRDERRIKHNVPGERERERMREREINNNRDKNKEKDK